MAEWLRGFSFTKRKGTIGNEPKVINRRRVAVWKAKEKGSGKENVPLDPLKRKGQGKRTRPGFLRNLFFQDRARAREAKASVRVFFFRGGRGGGGDRRQLLAAAAEIVGNCFPRGAKDFALWAWYCRHFDRRRIVERAYYYASCERQGEVRDGVTAFQSWLRKEFGERGGAR